MKIIVGAKEQKQLLHRFNNYCNKKPWNIIHKNAISLYKKTVKKNINGRCLKVSVCL